MWNEDLQKEVIDLWLDQTNYRQQTNEDLVQITPFEQLTLGCATCSNERYTLSTVWTPYMMDKSIAMQMFCYSEIDVMTPGEVVSWWAGDRNAWARNSNVLSNFNLFFWIIWPLGCFT